MTTVEIVLGLVTLVGVVALIGVMLAVVASARRGQNVELQTSQRMRTQPRNLQTPRGYLECQKGLLKGKQYALDLENIITFGRGPKNRIQIKEDSVSRYHAQITVRDNRFLLQDLESANGTFLNGERIAQAILQSGDEIQIGPCVFSYLVNEPRAEPRRHSEFPTPATPEILQGVRVEDYRIIRRIARGAVAAVYEAEEVATLSRVALKVLEQTDPYFRQKFEQEGHDIVQLLKPGHPNIVQVYRTGIVNEHQSFIAMELVDGKSLRHLLTSGKQFDELEVLEIALQVTDALEFAHQRGVVHRDLKPEHLMLDERKTVKVIDFGIAKLLANRTETSAGWIVGTPWYLSPEQARGERIDGRSDIYSFGIVMYEMLTGVPPFEGTAKQVIEKHLNLSPSSIQGHNPRISIEVEDLVLQAMARHPEHRFQSAGVMRQAILRLLGDTVGATGADHPATLDMKPQKHARLRFLEGGHHSYSILLDEEYMLGRQELSPGDKSVSRQHALIYEMRDGYWIEDQGSVNGTFLNGERLQGPLLLEDGDTITIGNVLLLFELM